MIDLLLVASNLNTMKNSMLGLYTRNALNQYAFILWNTLSLRKTFFDRLNYVTINFLYMINKLNFFYHPCSALHPPIYVIIYFIDPKSLRTMTEEQKIIYSNQSLFTFPTLLLNILQREGNRRISVNEQSIAISYFALVSGYGYLPMLLMKVSKFLIETRARTHALSSCAYWKSQWFP